MQSTNNLKCVSTNEQIRNAMTETKLSSTLSVDEKITKLTAIKAEYLISLERRGYKFKTLKPLKEL